MGAVTFWLITLYAVVVVVVSASVRTKLRPRCGSMFSKADSKCPLRVYTGVSSPLRIHSSASVHSEAPNCCRRCLNVSWMACSHFNEVICMTQISAIVQPGPGPTHSRLFSHDGCIGVWIMTRYLRLECELRGDDRLNQSGWVKSDSSLNRCSSKPQTKQQSHSFSLLFFQFTNLYWAQNFFFFKDIGPLKVSKIVTLFFIVCAFNLSS